MRLSIALEFAAIALALVFLVFVISVLQGCEPVKDPTAQEAAYTAALVSCVDKAKTLAESKACRSEVDKAWGITETVTKDGGK